jgi:hypothetical protein
VPTRGPLTRLLVGLVLIAGAAFAVVGGLALPPSGLVAVGIAGLVSACLAWGIARESSGRNGGVAVEAAWRTAAATVALLLVLSGAATIGGALLALLVAGSCVAVALSAWGLRSRRTGAPGPAAVLGLPLVTEVAALPVADLPTGALGQEWVRTSTALAGPLDPAARQALVARRQEALEELERRDPAGFARWLAAGPLAGTDPAGYLRHGDPAA